MLCGHEWKGNINKPLCCPRCKRYDWSKNKRRANAEEKSAEASYSNMKGGN